jgi:hypothetical protein
MAKYGRFNEDNELEIINTAQDVPEDKWSEKGLFPVVRVEETLADGVAVKPKEYSFMDTFVEERVFLYSPTLAERKEQVTEKLKSVFNQIMLGKYPDYEQRLAGLGLLPSTYTNNMKTVLSALLVKYNEYKSQLLGLDTKAKVDSFDAELDAWAEANL